MRPGAGAAAATLTVGSGALVDAAGALSSVEGPDAEAGLGLRVGVGANVTSEGLSGAPFPSRGCASGDGMGDLVETVSAPPVATRGGTSVGLGAVARLGPGGVRFAGSDGEGELPEASAGGGGGGGGGGGSGGAASSKQPNFSESGEPAASSEASCWTGGAFSDSCSAVWDVVIGPMSAQLAGKAAEGCRGTTARSEGGPPSPGLRAALPWSGLGWGKKIRPCPAVLCRAASCIFLRLGGGRGWGGGEDGGASRL